MPKPPPAPVFDLIRSRSDLDQVAEMMMSLATTKPVGKSGITEFCCPTLLPFET
ncbi:hypothetical protein D3C83_284010 [compost metagenome]